VPAKRAFEPAYPTQMIEVVVGVDEILDRLVGEGLPDLRHHRIGALVAQRTKSLNSTATLLWASCVVTTRCCVGSGALRTLSGTARAASALIFECPPNLISGIK
jgi:hypothetical protein